MTAREASRVLLGSENPPISRSLYLLNPFYWFRFDCYYHSIMLWEY